MDKEIRKAVFARALVETGGDRKEALEVAYPGLKFDSGKRRKILNLMRDGEVQALVRHFLLQSGVHEAMVESMRSTLMAVKTQEFRDGSVRSVPDNEARVKTQELILKSFGMGNEVKPAIIQQQSNMVLENIPSHILRYVAEKKMDRFPTEEEIVDGTVETGGTGTVQEG